MREQLPSDITLRFAQPADAGRLRTLAELDSARLPAGRLLVAELGGVIRAALALDGGDPIADPFHRTAELVALLRLRAAQLTEREAAAATSLSALERQSAHLRSAKPLAALRRSA